MPKYKFKFGEIDVAEGLPPLTPAVQAWTEAEADRLLGQAMRQVVEGLVQRLHQQDCMDAIAAPAVVGKVPSITTPASLPHLSTVQIGALSATQLEPVKPALPERPPMRMRAKRLSDGVMVEFTGRDLGIVDAFYQSEFVFDGQTLLHQQPVTALAAAPKINDARLALDLEFLRMVAGLDPETVEVL